MTARSIYPAGSLNANWFSFFNAITFQIVVGAPLILYAKSLGASATVLGVIAALPALLTILQIPGARFLGKISYRQLLFTGWGARTLIIFLIAAIPLLSFLNALAKISLLLFSLFLFHLLRGIASGAWLPWLTDLIPENVRGRFLSRDMLFVHIGSLAALLISAFLLARHTGAGEFAVIFLISAVAGGASLFYLHRIPDVEAHETILNSATRVPWKEIVTFPPFLHLLIYNILFVLTLGSIGVFTIAFLKTRLLYSESTIIYLSTLYFLGALLSLPLVGRMLDRTGSKIIVQLSMVLWTLIIFGWFLIAANLVAPGLFFIILLHLISGIAGPNFHLANTRLLMNTMPPMGRSHFFAFFSVIASLAMGITPVIWGIALDAMNFEITFGFIHWNRYSVFYLALVLFSLATLIYGNILRENQQPARNSFRNFFYTLSWKRLSRLWPR